MKVAGIKNSVNFLLVRESALDVVSSFQEAAYPSTGIRISSHMQPFI